MKFYFFEEHSMKKFVCLFACAAFASLIAATSHARPTYYKAFTEAYPKVDPVKLLGTADKCNICHGKNADTGKNSKKVRNDYGKALIEAGLTKKACGKIKSSDREGIEKIKSLLRKVHPKQPFGKNLDDGKTPIGDKP